MKNGRKIAVSFVAVMALLASICFAAGTVNVSSTQAKAMTAQKAGLVLLDVRTPEEYQQAHLKGAKLIPLNELPQRVNEIPRDKPILVYCAVGRRSLKAADFLSAQGYHEVYQISDGLISWYKNGFPLERPAH
ncbi:rhodanese-like domain-containing protein [Geomonas sp.]|uniref:rhodanese-like domain-containing protein n=1 Tax=Geomonas sp. TaxID=2651584 RepID=UPI002B48B7E6|nr:rhodanese-like domain-containing protein [Geomonas sp.]HJV36199.1 rhodanese-like domain-containing protein [Geomonas sp.]